jgi:hypothetical protein
MRRKISAQMLVKKNSISCALYFMLTPFAHCANLLVKWTPTSPSQRHWRIWKSWTCSGSRKIFPEFLKLLPFSVQVRKTCPGDQWYKTFKTCNKLESGNTKGGSITVPLASSLTGLESAVWQLTFFVFICKRTNPNQSNRRSMVQWYFPL